MSNKILNKEIEESEKIELAKEEKTRSMKEMEIEPMQEVIRENKNNHYDRFLSKCFKCYL